MPGQGLEQSGGVQPVRWSVVVLNGGSSAGKSSIARRLQTLLGPVWLTLGVDDLIRALPGGGETPGDQPPIEIGSDGAVTVGDDFRRIEGAWYAGLAAMARAGRTGTGPLAQELMRTQQDMAVGQSRRQAYQALAERTRVPDLGKFVRAVLQADVYGIPVAEVLRNQAAEARLRRRQHAEEKALQIPTKVVFPLMLFIMPFMFIVLLGPAAMDIMAAFG